MICLLSLPCSSRCWGYFKESPEKCPPSSCWQLHHRWKHPKTGRQIPQKIPTRGFSLPVFPPLYFPTITQTCESPARENPSAGASPGSSPQPKLQLRCAPNPSAFRLAPHPIPPLFTPQLQGLLPLPVRSGPLVALPVCARRARLAPDFSRWDQRGQRHRCPLLRG